MAQARHRKTLDEHARDRWREGNPRACEVQQRGPATLVVNVADGGGDMHAWCLEAMRRWPGEWEACIIRAKYHRRIATGPEPRYVWEDMPKARTAGRIPGIQSIWRGDQRLHEFIDAGETHRTVSAL